MFWKKVRKFTVQFDKHKPGMEIEIDIRGNMKKAIIIKPPFYKQGTAQS